MIFIPFEIFTRGFGGPSTFMRNLRQFLIEHDYPFTEEIDKARQSDSIFFPMSFNERLLKYFKKIKNRSSRGLTVFITLPNMALNTGS